MLRPLRSPTAPTLLLAGGLALFGVCRAAPPTRVATAPALSACAAPAGLTPIPVVQGQADRSPLEGQMVTTWGVVTADFAGPPPALGGLFLQDPQGDGDSRTSDALFVRLDSAHTLQVGEAVRVRGRVTEVDGQTTLADATEWQRCGRGPVVPVATLPVDAAGFEAFEGMRVRVAEPMTVVEHYQLGRFGQVVLAAGGRQWQPTQRGAPGAAADSQARAQLRTRLILDDATLAQNPDPLVFGRGGQPLSATNTLRAGDVVRELEGILTFTGGGHTSAPPAWRMRPVPDRPPVFEAANPRPLAPRPVGGTLRVSAFNVLNYFNTFGRGACTLGAGGPPTDCRGAPDSVDFARQAAKIVAALVAIDADILGLIEIENDGYGPASAIADLVQRLNATTAPGTYALLDVDARTGLHDALGDDAIKVGLLYKPARVTPSGRTAVLATRAFVFGGDGAPRSRPSLVQAFTQPDGETLVVSVNHFKSKGSACEEPDVSDGQGHCNAVRTRAARALAAFLASDPTGTGDPDVLLLGDLNANAQEDPVRVLREAGFADLEAQFVGEASYSYLFDGRLGRLDHALASASLTAQVTGVTLWHINADEPPVLGYERAFKSAAQREQLYAPDPFRSSDHDPVVVGVRLRAR
jgi:predicted extracellular nuclease